MLPVGLLLGLSISTAAFFDSRSAARPGLVLIAALAVHQGRYLRAARRARCGCAGAGHLGMAYRLYPCIIPDRRTKGQAVNRPEALEVLLACVAV